MSEILDAIKPIPGIAEALAAITAGMGEEQRVNAELAIGVIVARCVHLARVQAASEVGVMLTESMLAGKPMPVIAVSAQAMVAHIVGFHDGDHDGCPRCAQDFAELYDQAAKAAASPGLVARFADKILGRT